MAEIDWTVLGPLAAKVLTDIVIAERARTGKTVEEIFADNDVKIAGNDAKLIADLIRLQGHV